MMKKLALWLLLAASVCGHAWAQPLQGFNLLKDCPNPQLCASNIGAPNKSQLGNLQKYWGGTIPMLWAHNVGVGNQTVNTTSDPGGSSRLCYQASLPGHNVFGHIVLTDMSGSTGGDFPLPNPVTFHSVLQSTPSMGTSGSGNILWPLTWNGVNTITVNSFADLTSDPTSLSVRAGEWVCVVTYVQVSDPPQNVAISAASTGGSLPAQTNYYKITTVAGAQGESGPSAEVNVATTGTTSAVTLTWQQNPLSVAATAFNIYAGTASGAEVLVATVPASLTSNIQSWTDTGSNTALAPTLSSIVATTGTGTLVGSGARFYYTVVAKNPGAGQSGASASINAVLTGTGEIAFNITPNAARATPVSYDIYRGGAPSLSVNTPEYLTTIAGTSTSFTDNGSYTVANTSFPAPPAAVAVSTIAAQVYPVGPWTSANARNAIGGPSEGVNYLWAQAGTNGTGADLTGVASGAVYTTQSSYSFNIPELDYTPDAGQDATGIACLFGDSVQSGTGDTTYSDVSFVAYAMIQNMVPYHHMARAGESVVTFSPATSNSLYTRARLKMAGGCTDTFNDYGGNDYYLYYYPAWLFEENNLTLDKEFLKYNPMMRVYQETIPPKGTTTDVGVTTTNQYPGGKVTVSAITNATPAVVTTTTQYYPQAWIASHAYSGNSPSPRVLVGTNVYVLVVAGTSGATAPTWPSQGQVTDGTAVWEYEGGPMKVYLNGCGNVAQGDYYVGTAASSTTFPIYNDAGLTSPVAGSGTFTSCSASIGWLEYTRVVYDTWLRCGAPVLTTANIAGYFAAGVFTLTSAPSIGQLTQGQVLGGSATGITPNTTILALLTGTGGVGSTYSVTQYQTLGSSGSPVTGITATGAYRVPCGTTGAVSAGQTGNPIYAGLDAITGSGLEVNLAGTPTMNGGRWGTTYVVPDMVHPSTAAIENGLAANVSVSAIAPP